MRRTLAMLLALVGLTAQAATAAPLPGVITVAAYSYVPGDTDLREVPLTIGQGASLLFASTDNLGFHSIVSEETHPDATPLFWAEQIGPGQVTPVNGVPGLGPGTYRFYCSNHPDMTGLLTVTPA